MIKSLTFGVLLGLVGVAVYFGLGYVLGSNAKFAAFLIVFLLTFGIRLGGYPLSPRLTRYIAYVLLYVTYFVERAWEFFLIKSYYGIIKNFAVYLFVHFPNYYFETLIVGNLLSDLLLYSAIAWLAVNIFIPRKKKKIEIPVEE